MKKQGKDSGLTILESISQNELKKYRRDYAALNSHVHHEYHYYAEQRRQIFPKLCESLQCNWVELTDSKFQRAVNFKYALEPLSARGSILSETGGRFNFGDINPNLPKFPALYLAANNKTAIKEKYQDRLINKEDGLSIEDLNLIPNDSFSTITVNVSLPRVLDLRDKNNLKSFYNVIKAIKPYKAQGAIVKTKIIKKWQKGREIKSLQQLYASIFSPNYEFMSLHFDLPANSQILGHIALEAKLNGILYPSRMTGDTCLAIFPSNFENSNARVWLNENDVPANLDPKQREMNQYNYRAFC